MDRGLAEFYYRVGFDHGRESGRKYNFDAIYDHVTTSLTGSSGTSMSASIPIEESTSNLSSQISKFSFESTRASEAIPAPVGTSTGPETLGVVYSRSEPDPSSHHAYNDPSTHRAYNYPSSSRPYDIPERGHRQRTTEDPKIPCLHKDCEYETKRPYDLDRHTASKHPSALSEKFDCPGRGCGKTGEFGFNRKDHLTEHLRKVHAKDIPKNIPRRGRSRH